MEHSTRATMLRMLTVALAVAGCQPVPAPPAPDAHADLGDPVPSHFAALRLRALSGDPVAALRLGTLYDTGREVPQDFTRALSWYRRAAELGSVLGAFNAGVMYDSGRGAPTDRAMAARYYADAADRGNGRAAYNLALLLRRGDGVAADPAAAARYMAIAAENGITAARPTVAAAGPRMAKGQMPASALDRAQTAILADGVASGGRAAADDMKAAAARGDPVAEYNLGYFYEKGIGVPRDPAEAYAWYSRAALGAEGPARVAAERGARETGADLTEQQRDAARAALPAQTAAH